MRCTKTTSVDLTQNAWTQLVPYQGNRTLLEVQNLDESDAVYLTVTENPWSLSFDGTDDYATVGVDAILDEENNPIVDDQGFIIEDEGGKFLSAIEDDTTGSIKCAFLADAQLSTADRVLFSVCDTGGDVNYLSLFVDTTGRVAAKLVLDGVTQWHIRTSFTIDASTYYMVKLVQNGTAPKIHLNGAVSSVTTLTDTDETAWISDISEDADTVYFGCHDIGGVAEDFFAGDIHYIEYVQGVNGFGLDPAVRIARWRMDEGYGVYGEADEDSDYTATFSANDGPTWADFEPGINIGANQEWSAPEGVRTTPEGAVWAKTSGASVNVRVMVGNNAKLANV